MLEEISGSDTFASIDPLFYLDSFFKLPFAILLEIIDLPEGTEVMLMHWLN
jgi:hypothetical protein